MTRMYHTNTMSHRASASYAEAACSCARSASMQSAANIAIILDAISMASIIICALVILAILGNSLQVSLAVLVLLVIRKVKNAPKKATHV